MATRRRSNEPQHAKLNAQQMRDAIPKLQRRIDELKLLDPSKLVERGDPQFEAIETKVNHTLREIFGPESVEYNEYFVRLDTAGLNMMHATPMHEVVEGYKRGIARSVANLDSLVALFTEEIDGAVGGGELPPLVNIASRKVFVVHGHDEAAKQEVARFLEKLQLEPVVLHEQVNEGQTIIEKFEKHAKAVGFAVVLLTPDDIGYRAGMQAEAKSRARQNVILEFGFFVSRLGRERVVALIKGDVEIPSDLHGLIYEKMDEGGAWQFRVAKEMRAVGIEIDMNRI